MTKFGNTLYYEDQVDNYKQNHLQIHWNQIYQNGWNSNFGIHFTNGRGFYENYNLGYDNLITLIEDGLIMIFMAFYTV